MSTRIGSDHRRFLFQLRPYSARRCRHYGDEEGEGCGISIDNSTRSFYSLTVTGQAQLDTQLGQWRYADFTTTGALTPSLTDGTYLQAAWVGMIDATGAISGAE